MRQPTESPSANGASPTVLVTGGSGFIGSHVVDVLIKRGYTPRIYDLRESPHHEPGSIDTVIGCATDTQALARAMDGCQAVIHLAAMADVGHVQKDPAGAERLNSRATSAVLEAARETGVKRVVYGSTIWVYSDCADTAVDEDTPLAHPAHLYSATKLAGELYCRSYAELYGVEYTILRFGIPYGPRARVAAVVPAMVEKALGGQPLTVAGDGMQGRRFVYVEDLAAGVVEGLAPQAANRIYNLAGNETTTIREIAHTVRDLLGDVEITHTEGRPGDFSGKEVSNKRALEELGWSAATPFREGVRRYVEWRHHHDPVAGEPVQAPVPAARASLRQRLTPRIPSISVAIPRRAITTAALTASIGWGVASDDSFTLLAKAFGGGPTTSVKTNRPEVGVLVDAPASLAPAIAQELRRNGGGASVALNGEVAPSTITTVKAAGSDAVPRLKPGGPVRWLGTRQQIKHMAKELGISGHIYYEAPGHGYTYMQSVLGRTSGASALRGRLRLAGPSSLTKLRRGDIVEISVAPGAHWRSTVDWLAAELRARHLRAVPADMLIRHKA
ncbi:MAG: UDP-glucose 4-epimerase [Thermoleophilaceae bacterium]|nr:UDP-glucose 4-epimerase [Thermoleophilaceae bacterium]